MGARLYRVDPRDFAAPPVSRKREARRKVPRAVRAQLYQLMLTVRETEAEIRTILYTYGVQTKCSQWNALKKISRERGA